MLKKNNKKNIVINNYNNNNDNKNNDDKRGYLYLVWIREFAKLNQLIIKFGYSEEEIPFIRTNKYGTGSELITYFYVKNPRKLELKLINIFSLINENDSILKYYGKEYFSIDPYIMIGIIKQYIGNNLIEEMNIEKDILNKRYNKLSLYFDDKINNNIFNYVKNINNNYENNYINRQNYFYNFYIKNLYNDVYKSFYSNLLVITSEILVTNEIILNVHNKELEHKEIEHKEIENKEVEYGEIENKEIENKEIENKEIEYREIENKRIENKYIENKKLEYEKLEYEKLEYEKIVNKEIFICPRCKRKFTTKYNLIKHAKIPKICENKIIYNKILEEHRKNALKT